MQKAVAALAAMIPAAALAQELAPAETRTVLAEGRPLASVSLSEAHRPALPGMLPEGTRMHELFIAHGDGLYLCYLKGSTTSGTPPYASCFGPRLSGS